MRQESLTVVLATRNRADLLAQTLEAFSKLSSPRGKWSLLVIDNGSTDGTSDLLQRWRARLPLRTLSHKRPGMNAALNAALPHVSGDLMVKADDDILPEEDWLVRLRDAADSHPTVSLFGCTVRPLWPRQPPPWLTEAAVPFSVLFAACARDSGPCSPRDIYGPTWAIRTGIFDGGTRFDDRFGPDDGNDAYTMGGESEFFVRLAQDGHTGWFVAESVINHIVRPEQMTERWILTRAARYGRSVARLDPPSWALGPIGPFGLRPGLVARRACYGIVAAAAVAMPATPRLLRIRYRARFLAGLAAALRELPHDRPRSEQRRPTVISIPSGQPPGITVCICTHDRPGYVSDCLGGLATQTVGADAFELLIVDSASGPDAASALSDVAARTHNARLIRLDRPGISHARNTGAREARTEFIAYIDDDAIPAPDWIEQIRAVIATQARPPALIGGRVLPLWESPLPAWWPRSLRGVLSIIETEGQGEYRSPALPAKLEPYAVNMIVHVATLLAAGGFRENLGRVRGNLVSDEEVHLAWRLQTDGHSAIYDSRIVVFHQIQAARMTPRWLLSRLYWQGFSTVMTRYALGVGLKSWRELPRRLAVIAITLPASVVADDDTRLIALRWRCAYARGFVRGLFMNRPTHGRIR